MISLHDAIIPLLYVRMLMSHSRHDVKRITLVLRKAAQLWSDEIICVTHLNKLNLAKRPSHVIHPDEGGRVEIWDTPDDDNWDVSLINLFSREKG